MKRRLRELVRELLLPTNAPIDVVIWAQRAAYDTPLERLRQEVEQLLQRVRRAGEGER